MIGEWIICIVSLVISVVFFALTFTFPQLAGDPGGPALFPRVLSVITGAGAIFLIVQLLRRHLSYVPSPVDCVRNFCALWRRRTVDESSVTARRMTYVFIFSIVYPMFIVRAGFLLSTGAYVFILMKLFRTKILASVILSSVIALTLHFFFVKVLEAYVPPGIWLEGFLE